MRLYILYKNGEPIWIGYGVKEGKYITFSNGVGNIEIKGHSFLVRDNRKAYVATKKRLKEVSHFIKTKVLWLSVYYLREIETLSIIMNRDIYVTPSGRNYYLNELGEGISIFSHIDGIIVNRSRNDTNVDKTHHINYYIELCNKYRRGLDFLKNIINK